MKVKVIASGSKGNCTLVQTGEINILIDMGITYQYLACELDKISFNPKNINAILITHTHSDHIKGLASLVNKVNLKVFILKEMEEEIIKKIPKENIYIYDEPTILNDLTINLIRTSHDVDGVGYIIESNNHTLVYITDTGYINRKYLPLLKNKDIYIIESNHDEQMLMEGPYPYILKQRVISDKGHLSNHTTANYLLNSVGSKTKYIILAHISENNNTEELALSTTKDLLEYNNIKTTVIVAKQYESLEEIEI